MKLIYNQLRILLYYIKKWHPDNDAEAQFQYDLFKTIYGMQDYLEEKQKWEKEH